LRRAGERISPQLVSLRRRQQFDGKDDLGVVDDLEQLERRRVAWLR